VAGKTQALALIAILLLWTAPVLAGSPDDILGRWSTEGNESLLEFSRCGAHVCGKIVWLKEPNYTDRKEGPIGEVKVDRNNPDPALRKQPILGLEVMWNLTPVGENRWEHGACYDPDNGKSYQCRMTLASPQRLVLRGFIGLPLLGRSYTLTRGGSLHSSVQRPKVKTPEIY
jgi:uncharacterized protein (DUF2147 family)